MDSFVEAPLPNYFTPEERSLVCGKRIELSEVESLRGWYPVAADDDGLWWRFVGDKRFSEPFFHNTVAAVSKPERLCLHTSYDAPDTLADTLAPTAFIFHISRCGSTLMCQLLDSLPSCVTLSEPPAVDSFLRRYYAKADMPDAERKLRAIVSALGQKRFAEERHLFIKPNSWHIGSLALYRRAFPDTPFLFVYRRPDEVMASHRRQRGPQMVPGLVDAAMPNSAVAPAEPHDLEGYCANVLEYFFNSALTRAGDLVLVDYRQLPALVWNELLGKFSIDTTADELAAMQARAGVHSKTGGKFAGDPKTAQAGATPESLTRCYEALDRIRLGRQ